MAGRRSVMANSKRRCKHCKEYVKDFIKLPSGTFCTIEHATEFGRAKAKKDREKAYSAETRRMKAEHRRSDLKIRKAAAKSACHKYIRERDKGKPCICCGRPLGDKYDAGHFLESGNNPLVRYHEDNIHAQSVYCNQYQGGDSDDYEGRLRQKIGDDRVDWLKQNKGGVIKRTADDYIEIEKYYKQKLKELDKTTNNLK